MKKLVAFFSLFGLFSCFLFYPVKTPMEKILYSGAGPQKNKTLLVLLPGRQDRAADFQAQGWIRLIQESGLKIDILAADATFGYYIQRIFIQRFHEDIILPALKEGYENLWILGVSVGGFGALMYAKEHPEIIQKIFLIAPYLGESEIIKEIESSGGIVAWNPERKKFPEEDYQRSLWAWLQQYENPREPLPEIYLGFGTEDDFVKAHRILSAVIAPKRIFSITGNHDWTPWKEILSAFLGLLKKNASSTRSQFFSES